MESDKPREMQDHCALGDEVLEASSPSVTGPVLRDLLHARLRPSTALHADAAQYRRASLDGEENNDKSLNFLRSSIGRHLTGCHPERNPE